MSCNIRFGIGLVSLLGGIFSVSAEMGELPLEVNHVFVKDSKSAQVAPGIASPSLTAEIVFAPECDTLLPPGGKTSGYGRCLFNLGSGYYSGFRMFLKEHANGLLTPVFSVGRPKGGSVSARSSVSVMRGITNYVAVAWDGKVARFRVNGLDVSPIPLVCDWTPPENPRGLAVGNTGWGLDPMPVRVLGARVWNRTLTQGELAARDLYGTMTKRPAVLRLLDFLGQTGATAENTSMTLAALDELVKEAGIPSGFSNTLIRVRAELLLREGHVAQGAALLRPLENEGVVPSVDVFCRWAEARAAERKGDWRLAAEYYAGLANDARVPSHIARDARDQSARCVARSEGRTEIADGELARRPVPPAPSPSRCFFVSPTGSDNAEGSEGHPFRTLVRARDAVRAFRKSQNGRLPVGGVCIYLREGRHVVADTLTLDAEDSGEAGAPVVWRAWKEERPVLDGGFVVPALGPVSDATAWARIPQSARGKVLVADVSSASSELFGAFESYGTHFFKPSRRVTDLYCDGEPLTRARHPNTGWLRVETATNHTFTATLDCTPWMLDREPGLVACGYWTYFWADATVPVVGLDPASCTFTLAQGLAAFAKPKAGQTFRLENALAAVDEPGEWFLDRSAQKLYVYPRKTAGRYVLSGVGKAFISAKGVSHLRIEGLVFEHGRSDALTFENISDFVFAGNVVRRFGGDGLRLSNVRRTLVADNVFHTFGHTALELTSGDRKTLISGETAIANNSFSDTGRAQRTYSPGIHANGVGLEIVHNHFHDIPSSAMSLGGNEIYAAWNVAERVVTESDDQGGIDMWANTSWAGIEMSFNLWKDVGGVGEDGFPAGRAGIRLDDAISGMSIYGNRFIDSSKGHFGGVQIHAGRCNFVDNNLFAGGVCGVSFSVWGQDWWKKFFARSDVKKWLHEEVQIDRVPYADKYPHMLSLPETPMVNHVTRNTFSEVGEVFRNPPSMTDARLNRFPARRDVAEALPDQSLYMRPLPPISALGLYSTTSAARAARNDNGR